jgi:hypothetical protein
MSQNKPLKNYISPLPQDIKIAIEKYYEELKSNQEDLNIYENLKEKIEETSINIKVKETKPEFENIININSHNEVISLKKIALVFSIINLIVSFITYLLFDFNNNQFQYIQEQINLNVYNIYLGIDGISIYFVLLTTIITPIAIISN